MLNCNIYHIIKALSKYYCLQPGTGRNGKLWQSSRLTTYRGPVKQTADRKVATQKFLSVPASQAMAVFIAFISNANCRIPVSLPWRDVTKTALNDLIFRVCVCHALTAISAAAFHIGHSFWEDLHGGTTAGQPATYKVQEGKLCSTRQAKEARRTISSVAAARK